MVWSNLRRTPASRETPRLRVNADDEATPLSTPGSKSFMATVVLPDTELRPQGSSRDEMRGTGNWLLHRQLLSALFEPIPDSDQRPVSGFQPSFFNTIAQKSPDFFGINPGVNRSPQTIVRLHYASSKNASFRVFSTGPVHDQMADAMIAV